MSKNIIADNVKTPTSLTVVINASSDCNSQLEIPVSFRVNGLWLSSKKLEIQLPYDCSIDSVIDYVSKVIKENITFVPNFNDSRYQHLANELNEHVHGSIITEVLGYAYAEDSITSTIVLKSEARDESLGLTVTARYVVSKYDTLMLHG